MRLENREIRLAHPSVEKFEKYKINIPASKLDISSQGIIQSLKVNYRKCSAENVLDDFENKQETTITLLIAVNWLY